MPRIAVHGHRGARALRPENTMAAFTYAIAAGVDAIELDVLATSDGVVVVTHDPVAAGGAVIRETPFDRVRQWDVGSARHPDFPRQVTAPGARVPTLDEVFALPGNFRFNVEIKSFPEHPGWAPAPPDFAQLVVACIRRNGVEERTIVQSFDHRALRAVKQRLPTVALAALFAAGDGDFAAIARSAGAAIAAPHHTLVTAEKVRQAHAAGIQVIPWTANTEAAWERLARAGADGIITDDPAGLIAYFHGVKSA